MTRSWWYSAKRDRFTPKQYAELKARPFISDWPRARWDDPDSSRITWMSAVYGDPDAELPDGYIQINTSNHTFIVKEWSKEWSPVGESAFFRLVEAGVLRLAQVQGRLRGVTDPEIFLTAIVDEDGLVKSTSRVPGPKGEKQFISSSPWPGLDADSSLLRVPYPEFGEYDALIDKAHEAFDFFLSGPDPRLVERGPDPVRETPKLVVAGATLTFTARRDTALSAEEKAQVERIVAEMPEVKGERLELADQPSEPGAVLQGSSALWGFEPVSDIVADLEIKLGALTLLRRAMPGAVWEVKLDAVTIPWNATLGRFEAPS